MLPQITAPIYEHTLVGLGKTIKYRPFTVKEQKILLMAKQDNTPKSRQLAIEQVMGLCTFGLDIKSLAVFDVIDLLIRIRSKSVDNIASHTYKYSWVPDGATEPKEEKILVKIDLDKVQVQQNPEHSRVVVLDTNIGIKMRYPTFADMGVEFEDDFQRIASHIESVYNGDEVTDASEVSLEQLTEFVDGFTAQNMLAVKKFYETMPKISYTQELKLKDGTTEVITYESLEDFFS